ncbi:hypothetical protein Tco_1398235 [Tanacetum coccineum]
MISCIEDLDFFKEFKNEFPAIVYNDALTSKSDFSTEPTLCPQNIDEFDLKDETSLSKYDEVEQSILYFNDLYPFNIVYPDNQKSDKGNDENEINMIQSSGGLTLDMRQDLAKRMRMVYTRDDGQEVFVSHDYKRLFGIQAPLVQEFILEFFSTYRIEDEIGLDVAGTLCFQLGAYRLGSERSNPDKGDLSDYWVEISFGRDFLRGAPSYTYIRDPVRRLCHRHAEGRKSGARLSRGNFIRRLTHHFGLVSDDGLRGLLVVARELLLIDMGELVKLNIYMEIRNDWAWVAPGPKRQQVAAAGAPKAAEDAPVVDEGAQADLTPIQAA